MADDWAMRRKQMREKLAELRNAALADLESRGYEVRGKTPIEIRQILKRRPAKQASSARSNHQNAISSDCVERGTEMDAKSPATECHMGVRKLR
jgi:hypothetical protein